MTTATEEGVVEPTPEQNPRNAAMDAIVNRLHANRTPREEEPEPEEREEEDTPPEIEDPEPPTPAAEEMIEVTIDGEKQRVPLSKIKDAGIRTFQKESTADKRLEEATRLFKAAQSYQQPPPPPPASESMDEELEKAVEVIQYGDKDQGVRAMKTLIDKLAPRGISLDEAERMIAVKLQHQAIRTQFARDFEDIAKDDLLYREATIRANQYIAQGYDPNDYAPYQKAGEDVKKWVESLRGGRMDTASREERKKKLDTVPAASARQAPPKPEPPPSTSDTIREMAKHRAF